MQFCMFDWNDVRYFLAVARAGSLASAGRTLGVDQSTVGRRIAALEAATGQTLLERTPRGLVATEAGQRVLVSAEAMADAAGDFAVGATRDAEDHVRVATTDSLAEHFVVPALAGVRKRHPHVSLAVQIAWASVNLLRGEADVAVRLVKPSHPRLVSKKVGDFALRAYAARSYLFARGMPTNELRGHDVLAYTEAAGSQLHIAGLDASDARVALASNNGTALLRAARAGMGVAELPSYVGDADDLLERVCIAHERRYSVYVVTHDQRRRARSVRLVSDAIAAAFRAKL